jgi:hypothetical protein
MAMAAKITRDVATVTSCIDPSVRIVTKSPKVGPREMENIRRGPNFGDFVSIRTEEASMQNITVARLQSTRVQNPLSPSFRFNVLRESLSVDSQNIPCAALKRRGSWVISGRTFTYIIHFSG